VRPLSEIVLLFSPLLYAAALVLLALAAGSAVVARFLDHGAEDGAAASRDQGALALSLALALPLGLGLLGQALFLFGLAGLFGVGAIAVVAGLALAVGWRGRVWEWVGARGLLAGSPASRGPGRRTLAVLGAIVLLAAIGLAPQLFAVCADEAFARVLGLRVRAYNLLIVVLAAVTVTTAMRTVGLLLVSALMVIPVATAQNIFKGFRAGLYGAMGIGVLVAVSGVFGSFYADVPPGAFIVVLAIGAFALSWPISSWRHRHRPLVSVDEVESLPHEPTPEHQHVHGPGCGHRVVEHGDHVDYVHDGHRHVAHADHYDEH